MKSFVSFSRKGKKSRNLRIQSHCGKTKIGITSEPKGKSSLCIPTLDFSIIMFNIRLSIAGGSLLIISKIIPRISTFAEGGCNFNEVK